MPVLSPASILPFEREDQLNEGAPWNPSRIFEFSGHDAILSVEQSLSLDWKAPTKKDNFFLPKKDDRAVVYRIGT